MLFVMIGGLENNERTKTKPVANKISTQKPPKKNSELLLERFPLPAKEFDNILGKVLGLLVRRKVATLGVKPPEYDVVFFLEPDPRRCGNLESWGA